MSEQREQRVLDALEQNRRRPPKFTAPRIDMSHGAGGKATHKLIEGLLLPALDNPALAPLSDAALLPFGDRLGTGSGVIVWLQLLVCASAAAGASETANNVTAAMCAIRRLMRRPRRQWRHGHRARVRLRPPAVRARGGSVR